VRLSRDNLIVLGILAVVVLTYSLVVYRAQSKSLDAAQVEMAERQRQLEANTRQATRVPPMIRQIEKMKQRFNQDWHRRLPQRQELAGFLREISSNLAQENLSNQMIQPGNPGRGRLYNRLPITMNFEGDFLALAGFLGRVDKMTRLTRIEKLIIQPARLGDGLSVELGMNIYFTDY